MAVDIKFSSEERFKKRAKVRGEDSNAPHTFTNSHTLLNPNQSSTLNAFTNSFPNFIIYSMLTCTVARIAFNILATTSSTYLSNRRATNGNANIK